MAFGDILAGLADASHEHQKNLFALDMQNRRDLAEQYGKISQDESYPEEMRAEALKRALNIHMLEPGKKMPKEFQSMTFQVAPRQAPQQEQPGSVAKGEPGAPMGLQMPPVAPPSMAGRTEQFAPMPFEERMRRFATETQIKGQPALDIATMKAAEWKRQTDFARDMPDGKRHKFVSETRVNPDTGAAERREVDLGDISNFAPRMGDLVTLEQAKRDQAAGLFEFKDMLGKNLDIDKMIEVDGPYATIRNKGNYYEPATVRNIITSVGNVSQFRNPYAPGAPGTAIGVTHPPVMTSSSRTQGVPQPTGEIKAVAMPSSSTRSVATAPMAPPTMPAPAGAVPGAPVAPPGVAVPPVTSPSVTRPPISQIGPPPPAPPPRGGAAKPGDVIGGRSLSPEQIITTSQKGEAFGNTADRLAGLMETINDPAFHFNDFIQRAKIAVAENPNTPVKQVLSNLMKLSPQEAKFIADFQSLAEDINLLRTTYSATGFRGPEAFTVLLGQRGQLLGNPAVAGQMMRNTMQSVLTQMTPIQQGLSKAGSPLALTPGVVNAYRWMVTGKPTKAMTPAETKKLMDALRQNGWIQ